MKTLRRMTMLGAIWLVLPSGQVNAQVMIDMSRVTCGQYLAMPPDQARVFSAWKRIF